MIFNSKGKDIELKDIQWIPSKVIISNNMEILLKKGHHGVLAQLFSLFVQTSRPFILMDLQKVMNNYSKVF
jgi:hypothetical protein